MAIELPAKFAEELAKPENVPSTIVAMGESFLVNTQTTKADWVANSSLFQINYDDIPGSVILAQDTIPTESQGTSDGVLEILRVTPPSTKIILPGWQSFKHTNGDGLSINTVKFTLSKFSASSAVTVNVEVWNSAKTLKLSSTKIQTVTSLVGALHTFDFSSESISMLDNTEYQIKVYGDATDTSILQGLFLFSNSAGGYANGVLEDSTGTPVGDAEFKISYFGNYYKTTGAIETQNMDLGEVPAVDGEWIILDQKKTAQGGALTYNAERSSTGVWGGEEVNMGAIVDGDPIEAADYAQYYRVTASLSTSDKNVTPELQEISASFTTFVTVSDDDSQDYEPSVKRVSSLTTNIGDFDNTTIGQLSITFARTELIESYFYSGSIYPKNKPVSVKFGFIDEAKTFTEADYLTFFTGVVDNYKVQGDDRIVLTIKDMYKQLDVDLPDSEDIESNPVTSPIVYTADHHVFAMLDILQSRVDIRDSQIDIDSFNTVEASLPGWEVTRTITNEQENAKELLEELRKLMSCYLIPKPDGKIFIKEWDPAEAQADAWTDDDFFPNGIKWDSNQKSIVNQQTAYFDMNPATLGDDKADYGEILVTVDSTSKTNYSETNEKILMDKWTFGDAQGISQITDFEAAIIARYADPPGILDVKMDLKKLRYEVGDIIDITSARPIGAASGGLTNVHFQIINKNLDFQNSGVSFKLLQVAG